MHPLPAGVTFFERGWLSSNNILIQDSSEAILIDSGYWTHAAQTQALIQSALPQRPLTKLINTHLHSDHCGGNAHLQTIYPSLKTYVPPGHASFVDNWNAQALTYTPTGQHCPKFVRSASLQDGEAFVVNKQTWRIYAAPGHDPHSVVLFNESAGVLISADALWENGFGVVFPEIEGINAFDEVDSTIQVIERLNPKLVLPGHGPAFSNVSAAIDRARSRLNQFRKSPTKHAAYAAKVLLKFKLLEFQKIKFTDFLEWGHGAEYLKLLSAEYAKNVSFDAWFFDLCKSLEKIAACAIDDEYIINVN
jgi:glyoxylase-like metal-dependent hydrolase (beta-lactamase superfamily II)